MAIDPLAQPKKLLGCLVLECKRVIYLSRLLVNKNIFVQFTWSAIDQPQAGTVCLPVCQD